MDLNLFISSIVLLRKESKLDDIRVFIHNLEDTSVFEYLTLHDSGWDYRYDNCLFLKQSNGWIFVTNMKSATMVQNTSRKVSVYSSSDIDFRDPIDKSTIRFLNYYFPQHRFMDHYHTSVEPLSEHGDMLLALMNFYSMSTKSLFMKPSHFLELSNVDRISTIFSNAVHKGTFEGVGLGALNCYMHPSENLVCVSTVEILTEGERVQNLERESKRRAIATAARLRPDRKDDESFYLPLPDQEVCWVYVTDSIEHNVPSSLFKLVTATLRGFIAGSLLNSSTENPVKGGRSGEGTKSVKGSKSSEGANGEAELSAPDHPNIGSKRRSEQGSAKRVTWANILETHQEIQSPMLPKTLADVRNIMRSPKLTVYKDHSPVAVGSPSSPSLNIPNSSRSPQQAESISPSPQHHPGSSDQTTASTIGSVSSGDNCRANITFDKNKCYRNMAKADLFMEIDQGDSKLASEYMEHMGCNEPECNYKGPKGKSDEKHYHCLVCKTFKYFKFRRVLKHSMKCKPVTENTVGQFNLKPVPYTELKSNTRPELVAFYKDAMRCRSCPANRKRAHYHCLECKSYSHNNLFTVLDHAYGRKTMCEDATDRASSLLSRSVQNSAVNHNSTGNEAQNSDDVPGQSEHARNENNSGVSPTVNMHISSEIENINESNSPAECNDCDIAVDVENNVDFSGSDISENNGETEALSVVQVNDNVRSCKADCLKSSRPRLHYHCTICESLKHTSKKDVTAHAIGCAKKYADIECAEKVREHKEMLKSIAAEDRMQVEIIDPEKGIYLVRKSLTGPASPVHVLVDSKDGKSVCTAIECNELGTFHKHNLKPAFACKHIKSCQNSITKAGPDLFNSNVLKNSSYAKVHDAVTAINKVVEGASINQTPVAKMFIPKPKSGGDATHRHVYFSVFGNFHVQKYYSHFNRTLVTLDRDTQKTKCQCSKPSDVCVHRKIVCAIVQNDTELKATRPEKNTTPSEISRARMTAKYLLENKKIPLDVTEYLDPKQVAHFIPSEEKCVNCNVDLTVHMSSNRGFIFTSRNTIHNVKITSKICDTCNLEYRYSTHKDGYFNYNNSSIFSIEFMELLLASWVVRSTVEGQLKILSIITKMTYNYNLIYDALKAYLSLKNIQDYEMSCNRCGYFPVECTYDAIRKVCFDVNAEEYVQQESDSGDMSYGSFSEVYEQCCIHDLARGILDNTLPNYQANLKSLSVKLARSYPAFVTPQNRGPPPPYTRMNAQHERPEEIDLSYERIKGIMDSKTAYKELEHLCKILGVDTSGGKMMMLERILKLDNKAELHSTIRKKFFSITGKSGGLMRGFCQHGVCYGLKILTLPESVADFTNIMASFKIPPNFNISDSAALVAIHTNNNIPGFFRPYLGRLDDFEDPSSELYKTGEKKALFDINRHTTRTLDMSQFDRDTAHPISGIYAVLSFYDRLHEHNHNEDDAHLRRLDNTNLEGHLNTQVAEQQNHLTSLSKSSLNGMGRNQFIKLSVYLTAVHNSQVNKSWKKKVEKSTKAETSIDELGFLVSPGTDKTNLLNAAAHVKPTAGIRASAFPSANLMCNSGENEMQRLVSDINCLVYLVSFTPIAEEVITSDCVDEHLSKLIKYVLNQSFYNPAEHHKTCKSIGRKLQDHGPVTIATTLEKFVKPNLLMCESGCAFGTMINSDIAESLELIVNKGNPGVDKYVIMTTGRCFNKVTTDTSYTGSASHLDVTFGNRVYRYQLEGQVIFQAGRNKCQVRFLSDVFELCNSNVSSIRLEQFLASSRFASILMFRQVDVYNEVGSTIPKKHCAKRHVSFTQDSSNKKIKVVHDVVDLTHTHSKRRKVLHDIIDVGDDAGPSAEQWRTASRTLGRCDLNTRHLKILKSDSEWYDDSIVNSYANRCCIEANNTFTFQDTLRGTPGMRLTFDSVNDKFIQIVNHRGRHWVTISNALTYPVEEDTVEIYDSLLGDTSLANSKVLQADLAKYVLLLRPSATCVRFIKTQVQTNSNDCGPYALGFLWSLSRGQNPAAYEYHLNPARIRTRVFETLDKNEFKIPTEVNPKPNMKSVLKEFHFDNVHSKFRS